MQTKELIESSGQKILYQENNLEPKGNGKVGFPILYLYVKAK